MSEEMIPESEWQGPVCLPRNSEGDFYASLAELFQDYERDEIPEGWVYGCTERGPKIYVEEVIGEDFIESGEYWPGAPDAWDLGGLQALLDAWCDRQPKNTWEPSVKVRLDAPEEAE